jgi:membrane protein DedA with SNARE-associated domain
MSWKKFLIVDGTSALLTITLWGGLGYVGGSSVQALKKDITNIEEMAMAILAILIGSILLLRYLKKRNTLRKSGPIERIDFQ